MQLNYVVFKGVQKARVETAGGPVNNGVPKAKNRVGRMASQNKEKVGYVIELLEVTFILFVLLLFFDEIGSSHASVQAASNREESNHMRSKHDSVAEALHYRSNNR